VWQATLPSRLELFDLARDPGEARDLASAEPQQVAEPKARIEELSREAARPLLLEAAFAASWSVLFSSVALPSDEANLVAEP
jgi:hypothetical protein